MQSLRDIFRRLPPDGAIRDALRKFNLSPVIDGKARSVKDLAVQLGFVVERCHLPNGMAGRLVRDAFAENGFRIEVNQTLSVQAQRFAVLHEIAHYFLHIDRDDPLETVAYLDRSGETFYVDLEEERQANEFAEVLLFGDGALEAARSLRGDDLRKLAHQFGVSEEVVGIGLRKLSKR